MALAWSRGAGNIVTIIPSTTADVMAPPMPWMKRATTSMLLALGGAAQDRGQR